MCDSHKDVVGFRIEGESKRSSKDDSKTRQKKENRNRIKKWHDKEKGSSGETRASEVDVYRSRKQREGGQQKKGKCRTRGSERKNKEKE